MMNVTFSVFCRFNLFNATSGTWTSGTWGSKIGRQYGVGVGCGGMLLFGGGQQSGGRSQLVDLYDIESRRWLPPAHLNASRSNLAAGCMGGRYAVFAGGQCVGHNKYVAEAMVDVYDTVENTWGLLHPLSYGRGKLVGAGVGKCVAFGGGGARPAGGADVDVFCVA
eukprot:COSAG01_NODE_2529_length_7496_cov_1044.247533_3_plen_166_part_00